MTRAILRFTSVLWFSASLAAAGVARAEGAGKIELKAEKGRATEFTVRESSSGETESSRGSFPTKNSSEILYKIEVADRKDNGDVTLKVTIASLKAKDEGRDRTWEFDSAKADGGDEGAAPLREVIGKPITVQVSGGKVKEMSGLPELQRPAEGEKRWRGFRAARLVGRGAVRGHLEMILASAVQGQAPEKGKEYKAAIERSDEDADREKRGRGRGRGERTALTYKFEGEEKSGDAPAAKFSLSPQSPPEGGDAAREQRKGSGTALVSLTDGLLIKLDFETEGRGEFERGGETAKFSRQSKIQIARGAPAPEPLRL